MHNLPQHRCYGRSRANRYLLKVAGFQALMTGWFWALADMIPHLERAKELAPNFAPARYWLTVAYMDDGKTDRRPERLLEADAMVRLLPRCWKGVQRRGTAWSEFGRTALMEKDYETALSLKPGDADLYYERGLACENLELWDKALQAYERSVGLHASGFGRGIVYDRLGNVYERLGNFKRALESYEAA